MATDNLTGETVALKRIGDVLQSVDYAKRVLREISILRRVNHPNLISLRDAFVRPSSTGQCRLIGGKLVSASIDLYLSMEYGDGGDLVSDGAGGISLRVQRQFDLVRSTVVCTPVDLLGTGP
jgi:mitogen-activated protein kinase 1/3